MSFTKDLPVLAFILIIVSLTSTRAANFNVINRCGFTVWAAATNGGIRLDPGRSWSLDVGRGATSWRIWGRTGCSFDGNGRGSCQTGDCGGLLVCNPSVSGRPPLTLAEFSLTDNDYYDISVIDGYNLAMEFAPLNNLNGNCRTLTCTSPNCPDAYHNPPDPKTHGCPSGTNYRVVFCP